MAQILVSLFVSHPVALLQYTRLLRDQPDFRLVEVQEASNVGVLDGETPCLDTVLSLARMKYPLMRPLLLSPSCDESESWRWFLRGVCGIVTYDSWEQDLCRAVRSLAKGQFWIQGFGAVTGHPLEKLAATPKGSHGLTQTEVVILGLLLRRLSNKEIASSLNISIRTVKFHVGNVLSKLQVTSRQDLWMNSLEFSAAGSVAPFFKRLYPGTVENG